MSRTTTSTLLFVLQKYSRSYPKANPDTQDTNWQHFTHPVIRLSLDITKGSPGEILEAVKLKVVWDTAPDEEGVDHDKTDVILESFDLLAFSKPSGKAQDQNSQSPPLKAVYRDAIVGIRYLHQHGSTAKSASVFRRFQICFSNSEDTLQFIRLIRPVCPCQHQSASTVAPVARPQATGPTSIVQTQTSKGTAMLPLAGETQYLPPSSASLLPGKPSLDRLPSSQTFSSSDIPNPSPAMPSPSLNFAGSSQPHSASLELLSNPEMHKPRTHTSLQSGTMLPSHLLPPSYELPSSLMHPPPPPTAGLSPAATEYLDLSSSSQAHPYADAQMSFVDRLENDLMLYELPSAELRVLVGKTLRQPGFLQLVRTLETVWDAKVFLDSNSTQSSQR